jgi:hypothetical protein
VAGKVSVFTKAMGFLTGGSKTADNVFDKDNGLLAKVGGWIGNNNFTPEEAAEMNAATGKAVRQFVVDTLGENTERSKARRDIAVFFIKFYALMLFMAGIVYPIDVGWSAVWVNLATSLSVGGLVTAISVFFFGSHAVAKYQDKKG